MTTQTVGLIQVDREDWANLLKDSIRAAAKRTAGDSQVIDFADNQAEADLILCLGSAEFKADLAAQSQIAAALRRGIRVLPIVSELSQFKTEVPIELYPINGMAWGNAAAIAEEVLRHLGLTERDRRVFLSYLRRETTPLAYQLYDELHRRRFSIFLDSFEIEHGELVQNRIVQALQHTSFVLLLYSPLVETSEWIEKEINFALTEGLGLVALALPNSEKKPPFHMTPSDRRVQLDPSDLEIDGRLSPTALDRICIEIEREHADQFRSRRESMVRDLSESLGNSAVRVGSQTLRYKGKKSDVFIRLNPRPPESLDLYLLDEDCPIEGGELKPPHRALVAVKGGYREDRDLTEWVCGNLKHTISWYEPQTICSDPGILEK